MNPSFSRTLSLLRQEKGVSQRSAARDLGVSQALLSHYENGAREPGLQFVVRVSDYYGVSADFLLGRTMSRDGTAIHFDEVHDSAQDKDNALRGSALALLQKKLLVNTIGIIFDILGKKGHNEMIGSAASYLSTAAYKVFRCIYMSAGTNPGAFFSVDPILFSDASDADMKLSEVRFKELLAAKPSGEDKPFPEISNDSLKREYPLLVQSLLSVLHTVGERVSSRL